MKVRMIIGEHEEHDSSMPVPQAYLAVVRFPFEEVPVYDPETKDDWCDEDDDSVLTLHNEAELEKWATLYFVSHEIWDMEIPEGAIVKDT